MAWAAYAQAEPESDGCKPMRVREGVPEFCGSGMEKGSSLRSRAAAQEWDNGAHEVRSPVGEEDLPCSLAPW